MSSIIGVLSPYWGKDLFQFFFTLFKRIGLYLTGELSLDQIASDEIQLIVLIAVAISSAILGVFLVLKKMTMLANSLSHTILLGIVIAYIFVPFFNHVLNVDALNIEFLMLASLITALITTILTQLLTDLFKLQEDASIGLVFTTFFALGIVLVTIFTRNAHIGTEAIMGNVDALHIHDFSLIAKVGICNFVVLIFCFRQLLMTTFDPGFAYSVGINTSLFNYLLMVLTAATAIGAFRAVGVLLFLSFLVGPVLTARLLTNHLKWLIVLAIGVGTLSSLFAVALSRHFFSIYQMPLSTSGLVVVIITFFYFFTLFLKFLFSQIPKLHQST